MQVTSSISQMCLTPMEKVVSLRNDQCYCGQSAGTPWCQVLMFSVKYQLIIDAFCLGYSLWCWHLLGYSFRSLKVYMMLSVAKLYAFRRKKSVYIIYIIQQCLDFEHHNLHLNCLKWTVYGRLLSHKTDRFFLLYIVQDFCHELLEIYYIHSV